MADLETELLYRLLTSNYGTMGVEEKIYISELPAGFPIDFPAGTRVLGGQEQKSSAFPGRKMGMNRQDHTRVLLDSALKVHEFIGQMRSRLGRDWEDIDWPPSMQGGFLPAEAQDALTVYSSSLQQSLHLRASEVKGVTQVTLDLNAHSDEARENMQRHFRHQPPPVSVRVPAGATVQPGGGGGNGQTWNAQAVIESALTAPELLNHFGGQLQDKGWQPLTPGQNGSMKAASWTNTQNGVVLITLHSDGQRHFANMITVQPEQGGNQGSRVQLSPIT
jgi:hypothetical protein